MFAILKNEGEAREYSAGDVVFADGDSSNGYMYTVLSGEIELLKHGSVLETVGVGGVFGEMAILDHHPRSATAIAKTRCRLGAIPESRFKALVGENPKFALGMLKLLTERLRRTTFG
jgi:CRP/FNR family cyclic AMP-dependent transcriptional regulator